MKEGDIVKLKSGGPEMVLSSINRFNGYLCKWFVNGILQTGCFELHDLVLCTKSE